MSAKSDCYDRSGWVSPLRRYHGATIRASTCEQPFEHSNRFSTQLAMAFAVTDLPFGVLTLRVHPE